MTFSAFWSHWIYVCQPETELTRDFALHRNFRLVVRVPRPDAVHHGQRQSSVAHVVGLGRLHVLDKPLYGVNAGTTHTRHFFASDATCLRFTQIFFFVFWIGFARSSFFERDRNWNDGDREWESVFTREDVKEGREENGEVRVMIQREAVREVERERERDWERKRGGERDWSLGSGVSVIRFGKISPLRQNFAT